MITDPDDFFVKGCGRCARFDTPECSAARWADGLAQLRAICLGLGLTETAKWGHPCYTYADRNIALLGAFRDNFRLNFMNPGLLKDPEGVLEKQGPNTATPGMIRFTANGAVAERADIIRAYLQELMAHAKAGTKPPKPATAPDIPDELTDALDADPELAEAFEDLTPGRKKGYFLHIGGAKQSKTRIARIEKLRDRIFAGKGYNER